uniref:Uncharacterized protein n=1 Tax=Aegilops tauschii subsp. strangulata TaxID=200361 RepID=A0A453KLH2_AEGTS
ITWGTHLASSPASAIYGSAAVARSHLLRCRSRRRRQSTAIHHHQRRLLLSLLLMLLQVQGMPTYTTRASSYWNMRRSRRGGMHDSVFCCLCDKATACFSGVEAKLFILLACNVPRAVHQVMPVQLTNNCKCHPQQLQI